RERRIKIVEMLLSQRDILDRRRGGLRRELRELVDPDPAHRLCNRRGRDGQSYPTRSIYLIAAVTAIQPIPAQLISARLIPAWPSHSSRWCPPSEVNLLRQLVDPAQTWRT